MSDFIDRVKKAAQNAWQIAHGKKRTRPILPPRPKLDRHAGLRNWFHAQYHLPRISRPLPPFYQAKQDLFANMVMARAHNHRHEHKRVPFLATPAFHNGNQRG